MEELITIIVPIYNSEKYIERCIKSLINQTYKNTEIILVDDGSKDNSLKICKEYAKQNLRIKIIHKDNEGVSSARNKGIKNSNGKYILFIDADDYIEANALEELSKIIEEYHPDLIRFQGIKEYLGKSIGENKLSRYGFLDIEKNKTEILKNFFNKKEFSNVIYIAYKTEVIKNLEFDTRFKWAEDWLFTFDTLLNSKTIYITDEKLYHYFINSESATHNIHTKERFIERFETHYKIDDIIYKKLMQNGYINLKKLALDTTYLCSEDLLKQMAEVFKYKDYKNIINEIQKKEFYIEYESKLNEEEKKEFNKIFKSKKLFILAYIKGKMKKIYYKIKK